MPSTFEIQHWGFVFSLACSSWIMHGSKTQKTFNLKIRENCHWSKKSVGSSVDVLYSHSFKNRFQVSIKATSWKTLKCHFNQASKTYLHRTFKPDFVLIRQGLGAATQHYENLITGLMFGAVPCMNSVEAVYNMRNKAWLVSSLQIIEYHSSTNCSKFC